MPNKRATGAKDDPILELKLKLKLKPKSKPDPGTSVAAVGG